MAGDDFLLIDVTGDELLAKKLKGLPPAVQDTITDDVSNYLINNILRIYPPKNYVTRAKAYGQSFFSDKQRRWFFAALRDGSISVPYKRSQGLANGWKQHGSGARSFLSNEYPGAKYVIGDGTQSRHEKLVGWLTVSETLKKHWKSIMDKADAAVKKAIKKQGL